MSPAKLVSLPIDTATFIARRALGLSFGVAKHGVSQATGLLQRLTGGAEENVTPTAPTVEAYPAEASVEVAVDEFGAVGSFTDNTGVEPDGQKPPFAGYDSLAGDRVIGYVSESTDLPDLQVLLAYEEAHKNRKGIVQAVEARLAQLGTPVS